MKQSDQEHSKPITNSDEPRNIEPAYLISIDWETVDDLLTTNLRIDDPNGLPGLVDIVPHDIEPVEIIHWYNCRDLVVRCSFCPQRQRHNKGLVVRLPDDSLALMGHDCVASHELGNFEEIRKYFDHRRNLQFYLQRVQPLEQAINRAKPILAEWRRALAHVSEFRASFRTTFPILFKELLEVAERYEGRLELEEEQRDFAAEEKRDRRVGVDSPEFGELIYKPTRVLIGRLIGYQFLIGDELFGALSNAEKNIRSAQRALQQRGDRAFLHELRKAFMNVKDARTDLGTAAESYKQFKQFIGDQNLNLIAKWAREVLEEPYALRGRGLVLRHPRDDSPPEILKKPKNLPELDLEVIEILNLDTSQR